MLNFLLSPLQKILALLAFAGVAVLALFGYGSKKKKEGKEEVVIEEMKENIVKRGKAREAAFKEKRDVDGLSDSDLVDRLRRRRDDWSKL